MSKEIPILFSGPMAIATLRCIKTQTRRMDGLHEVNEEPDRWKIFERNKLGQYILTANDARPDNYVYLTPRYNVGDIIWGREAWRADKRYDHLAPRDIPEGSVIRYESYGDFNQGGNFCFNAGKLRQSIFMARWMSRIQRVITDVRLERLRDITEEDAIAEGAEYHDGGMTGHSGWRHDPCGSVCPSARDSFCGFWNSLNAKRGLGLDKNPWVWAITFGVENDI